MADHDNIAAVVAAACAAAGPIGGASPAWKMKVTELIPEIAALMDENSRAWKQAEAILDADHIAGVYLGAELEETSTRLVVELLANNAQEPEHIRTPRTDTPEGKRMQNRLSHLNRGDRIHVWKVVEPMRNDPNKKVRYIGHFESYGPDPAVKTQPNVWAVPAAASRPAPRPTAGPGPGGNLADQINALPTMQKLAVRNAANKLGIANFMEPVDEEERGTVLRLIKEQTDETGNA